MKERLLLTVRRLAGLIACSLLMMLILMLGRAALVAMFFEWSDIFSNNDALALMLFNILRFDAQVAAYVVLLPTVLALTSLAVAKQSYQRFLATFNKVYYAFAAFLLIILTVVDLGFFRNFGTHINITFFDFFDEGPGGLVRTMWEEYNVMGYLFLLIAGCVAVYFAVALIEKQVLSTHKTPLVAPKSESSEPVIDAQTEPVINVPAAPSKLWTALRVLFVVVYLAGVVIAMRGSVWMYPLQEEDLQVSDNDKVNATVPNALYMLKTAWKEKKNSFLIPSDSKLLAEYGFSNLQEALDAYSGGRVELQGDTLRALEGALFETIGDSIATSPASSPAAAEDTASHSLPNIVIIYAESWSRYLFLIDHPGLDIAQGMERHFATDLFFENIQSVQNGTIASIENIIVSTPFPRLFRSRYRFATLPTSITLPFKDSGYTTEFISGMNMEWENCGETALYQQFDKATDKFDLLDEDTSYTNNGIGIYDEYLFDAISNRLQQTTDQPQMMLAITTTNHPPFDFPEQMRLPEIPDEVFADSVFAVDDKEVLRKYINGFRYLNQSMAHFLDSFKASPKAHNTIIVITGDHNVRSIIDYDKAGESYRYNVPLYIYLPPALRKANHREMTERIGSHDDILATLAPMAFRNTKYFKMGNNLLSDTLSERDFVSANVERVIAPDGEKKLKARDMLRQMYFRRIFERQKQ